MNRMRVVAGVGAVLLAALASTPAQAQTYRYWSYWIGGDQWSYSVRGPGSLVPPDRAVEGWRFGISPQDGSQASAPGTASRYDDLCPGQPEPPADSKRVAVVIDPGPKGIAPVGDTAPERSVRCVVVPAAASGLQILQEVAPLRFHSSGLICGIAGFPSTECPGQTTRASASPSAEPTRSPKPKATPTSKPSVAAPPTPTNSPKVSIVQQPGGASVADGATANGTSPTGAAGSPAPQPSAVALAPGDEDPPAAGTSPPAWITATGVGMIAVLLGMAVLLSRGRG